MTFAGKPATVIQASGSTAAPFDIEKMTKQNENIMVSTAGWLIQTWSALSLLAILFVLLFVPIPEDSNPFEITTAYDQFVTGLSPYSALIWAGFFAAGRGVRKRKNWARWVILSFAIISAVATTVDALLYRGSNAHALGLFLYIVAILFFIAPSVRRQFLPTLNGKEVEQEN